DATRAGLEERIGSVEVGLRGEISGLDQKIDATRAGLEERIGSVEVGLRGEISGLDQKIDATRSGLEEKIDRVRTELRSEFQDGFASLRTELKSDIQHLDDRIYSLGVGLKPLVEQAQRAEAS
ncbi:hypothetical protein AB3X52_01090, partial [Nocardioides sp. DS6]